MYNITYISNQNRIWLNKDLRVGTFAGLPLWAPEGSEPLRTRESSSENSEPHTCQAWLCGPGPSLSPRLLDSQLGSAHQF